MEQQSGKKVILSVRNVSKSFYDKKGGARLTVDQVSFDVYENEFLVILGPGRCGKTVLLNMIAGLMPCDSGSILFEGAQMDGPNDHIGMVFQKTGLFPWLTVRKNVEFGPAMRKVDPAQRAASAQHFIDLVGLHGFEDAYPHQLSGGMKQRAGIARAYCNDSRLLILDEPFGALDAQTRYQMQKEIQRITKEDRRTIIFVTNNIEEAVTLADRVIMLTKYPAKVKQIYDIDLPKPRDEISEAFLSTRKTLSDNADMAL